MARGPSRVARRAVKGLASLASTVSSGAGTVVLIYHRVGARTTLEIDLAAGTFERQIASLAAARRVAPLGSAIEALQAGVTADRSHDVVVTFDDGTDDFVEVALPVLVHHDVPVTLYLATAFVEEQRPFDGLGRPAVVGRAA